MDNFTGKFSGISASDSHQMEHEVVQLELEQTDSGALSGTFSVGFGHQMDDPSTYRWFNYPVTGQVQEDRPGTATLSGQLGCHRFSVKALTLRLFEREGFGIKTVRMLDLIPDPESATLRLREVTP